MNVWLFITVLTLNVASGFLAPSLLTAPSRLSGRLPAAGRLELSAHPSRNQPWRLGRPAYPRRCLYLALLSVAPSSRGGHLCQTAGTLDGEIQMRLSLSSEGGRGERNLWGSHPRRGDAPARQGPVQHSVGTGAPDGPCSFPNSLARSLFVPIGSLWLLLFKTSALVR